MEDVGGEGGLGWRGGFIDSGYFLDFGEDVCCWV